MLNSPSPSENNTDSDVSDVPSADWCARQWSALCEMLDVSAPTDVIPEIRDLQEANTTSSPNANAAASFETQKKLAEVGLSSVDDALEELRQLRAKCERLESEADTGPADSASPNASNAPSDAPALEQVLGIRSRLSAQMTRSMAEEAETLLREQRPQGEEPASAVSTDDILSTMRSLRNHAEALQAEEPTTDEAEQQDIADLFGIENIEEAHQLYDAIHRLHNSLSEALPGENSSSSNGPLHATLASLADQVDAFASEQTFSANENVPTPLLTSKPDRSPASPSTDDIPHVSTGDGAPITTPALQRTVQNMQPQLESLYAEKETLFTVGLDDAREAAGHIDALKTRLHTLQRTNVQHRQQLERLREVLGTVETNDIPQTVEISQRVSASGHASEPPSSAPASPEADSTADVPRPLPESTSARLDHMSEEERNELSVGLLCLNDEGTIEYVNEAALQVPGLNGDQTTPVGTSLFQLVPCTSNTLFLERFRNGVDNGQMDTCFPYTFLAPGTPPTTFIVHLYRAESSQANWLLLAPAADAEST